MSIGLKYVDPLNGVASLPAALVCVSPPATDVEPTDAQFRAYRESEAMLAILRSLHIIKQHNPTGFAANAATASGLFDAEEDARGGTDFTTDLLSDFDAPADPVFASITPSHADELTATAVTIAGTGFRFGATVTIGGEPCTLVTVVSAISITCVTPATLVADDYDIVVANVSGEPATEVDGWTSDEP